MLRHHSRLPICSSLPKLQHAWQAHFYLLLSILLPVLSLIQSPSSQQESLLVKTSFDPSVLLRDFSFSPKKQLPDIYYFNVIHCKNELWIPIHFGETLQNRWSHQPRYKLCVLCCCFQNKILSLCLLAPSRPNSVSSVLTHVSDCWEVRPALSESSSLSVQTSRFQLGLH